MNDLKERMIRGGFAKVCSQGANFVVRVGSLMILARLLDPKDFGLVGMVTAVTGVFQLFKDFGLSTATIQRKTVTDEQVSTLFWINMLLGAMLTILSLVMAPAIAKFYHEPKLFGVTAVLGVGFLFNAAGVQHSAILQRQMRFTTLAVIDSVSLLAGTAIGFAMAIRGFRYWALVATTIIVSTGLHDRYVANGGVDSGAAAQANWYPFYDWFWRHTHFEWPRSLCRLQS